MPVRRIQKPSPGRALQADRSRIMDDAGVRFVAGNTWRRRPPAGAGVPRTPPCRAKTAVRQLRTDDGRAPAPMRPRLCPHGAIGSEIAQRRLRRRRRASTRRGRSRCCSNAAGYQHQWLHPARRRTLHCEDRQGAQLQEAPRQAGLSAKKEDRARLDAILTTECRIVWRSCKTWPPTAPTRSRTMASRWNT